MAEYKTQIFNAGEYILHEGDQPHCAYIIKSGTVEVLKKRSDGKDAVLGVLRAGDIFGEMSMVDAEPRSASIRACDSGSLIVVDAPTFTQKQEALDVFSRKLVRTLISRLRQQNQQLADLTDPAELLKEAKKGRIEASKNTHTNVLIRDDYREKINFGDIELLFGDSNSQSRQGIKGGLHMQGFREIDDLSAANDFRKRVQERNYDLIIMDTSLGVAEIADVINDIRHARTVVSPYCVIFAIIDQPDPKTLELLADAGLDDVLVKPISLGNIIDRVERRIKRRKEFVVTLEYVGPDRRSSKRPGTEEIPLVNVPNPLSYKALGEVDAKVYDDICRQASIRIETLKIERKAVQIDWLRGKIESLVAEHQSPAYFIKRLGEVTKGLIQKLEMRNDIEHLQLCERILHMMDDFEAGTAEMGGDDWETFATMTRRLRLELKP